MSPSQVECASKVDYGGIVQLVLAGDPAGKTLLYKAFYNGLRFLAKRRCGELADECVELTIEDVIREIRAGKLGSPEQLVRLVRTSLHRVLATARNQSDIWPEVPQSLKISMLTVLKGLKPREVELLSRVYLRHQSEEKICHEMELTASCFQQMKAIGTRALRFAANQERVASAG